MNLEGRHLADLEAIATRSLAILKAMLHYKCLWMLLSEVEKRAKELNSMEFARRYL